MPIIELRTTIHAPVERCFDLARSIDLHKQSTEGTHEEAIAGVTSGLIGFGEQVTWRAKHFGITQTLTSKITAFQYPHHFRDEMLNGAFRMIRHDHHFEATAGSTIMYDKFEFESPGGIVGVLFNKLILIRYLRNLLIKRNQMIKTVAETLS
ncbi:SRPBCC family protein [Fulvivirgaceae bacterium PWU4]|uniref:SRPBCC family protein n=1 Tax=Chryseosolibacter histidini TaxID=2782349 RepID=A0AAP2GHE4_9BACT|nr:SRPBCC family protein [Chryseosolibacter histidini]MBT1695946.1 SRPBCC family protein [Chryseosolibacter histidini]